MSRAIPASLNEYLFTQSNPDGLIVDGGIMPLRNGSTDSTNYKYCLRGEDPIFLNEALHIRGLAGNGYGTSITPDKYIRSSKMAAFRDAIGSMWNSGYWSSRAPNIPAGVLDRYQQWEDYIRPYFTLPSTPQSAGDAYTVLDAEQVLDLFRDVKELNYAYRLGGRGSAVPYNYSQSYTYRWHEEENRPAYQPPSPDYDQTGSSYLWYDQGNWLWQKSQGYPSDVANHTTWKTIANSLTFTERTSTPPNVAKTCVEIRPWAEMEVANYGQTSDYNGQSGERVSEYKYAVVPLKSGYTDMLNETVPTVNSSELDAAINLAYSTAGLERNAEDI